MLNWPKAISQTGRDEFHESPVGERPFAEFTPAPNIDDSGPKKLISQATLRPPNVRVFRVDQEVSGTQFEDMISDAPQPGFLRQLETLCRQLCEADWEDINGPLRLSGNLLSAELEQASFYQNTRILLLSLREHDGTPATTAGNLTRAFVQQSFERMAPQVLLPRVLRQMREAMVSEFDSEAWILSG